MSIIKLLIAVVYFLTTSRAHLMLPYKSVEGTQAFCSRDFGTSALYNIHIALHSSGKAYFQVAKEPVFPQEFPIRIQCDGQREYVFADWNQYTHNGIPQYRGFIGQFPPDVHEISCNVTINNQSHMLHTKRPIVPRTFKGKPIDKEFEVVAIAPEDSLKGKYTWSNDELLQDEECEKLVESFKSKPKLSDELKQATNEVLRKSKVYVSLTTSPKRLFKLHYVLQTLDMDRVEKIFITLPERYKNRDPYTIPRKLLKAFPKIQFLSSNLDIGPALKVAGASAFLQKRGKGSDVLVIIDDDNVYGPSLLDTCAYFCKKIPNGIFATSILDFINFYGLPPVHSEADQFLGRINVIEGFCGYASLAGNFDVELIVALTRRDRNPILSPVFLSDDLAISFAAAFTGLIFNTTLVRETPFYNRWQRADLPYYKDEDALHLYNADDTREKSLCNTVKYPQCMEIILKFALDMEKDGLPYVSRTELLKRLRHPIKF